MGLKEKPRFLLNSGKFHQFVGEVGRCIVGTANVVEMPKSPGRNEAFGRAVYLLAECTGAFENRVDRFNQTAAGSAASVSHCSCPRFSCLQS